MHLKNRFYREELALRSSRLKSAFMVIIIALTTGVDFTPIVQASEKTIAFDFTGSESLQLLQQDDRNKVAITEWGWIPRNHSPAQAWKLNFELPDPVSISRTPFLCLHLHPMGTQIVDVSISWKLVEDRNYTIPWGNVDVSYHVREGTDSELIIDLRRCVHGIPIDSTYYEISLKTADDQRILPAIQSMQFEPPSLSKLILERFQRLVSFQYKYAYLSVAAVFACGAIFIFFFRFIRSYHQEKQKAAFPGLGLIVTFSMVIWMGEAIVFGLQEARNFFQYHIRFIGLPMDEVHEKQLGDWVRLLDAARDLLPSDTRAYVAGSREKRQYFAHYAAYHLYPMDISLDRIRNTILCIDLPGLTPDNIARAERSGLFFIGSTSDKNYIFSKTPPLKMMDPGRNILFSNSWKLSACSNGRLLANIFDPSMDTRWDSGHPMQPGDWIEIEFPSPKEICGIRCWHYGSWNDYPRGYRIGYLDENSVWRYVVLKKPDFLPRGYFQESFGPVTTNRIRIEQTGMHLGYYWSIHDLQLFEPIGGRS